MLDDYGFVCEPKRSEKLLDACVGWDVFLCAIECDVHGFGLRPSMVICQWSLAGVVAGVVARVVY